MLKIAHHPVYAHPLPQGHRFPMMKYELIPLQLLHEGSIRPENFFSPGMADEQYILLAHSEDYWNKLKSLSLSPQEIRRMGFPLTQLLVERELRITQGSIGCANYALEYGIAMNVAGGTHHAGSGWGEGFCLLNDFAVAASYLLYHSLAKKILIIDLDVHQGNGTAEIFKNEDRVFTFSAHAQNNFPYRKECSDLDIALIDGTTDDEYLQMLQEHIPVLLQNFKPDFVFYLSGVDILASDKLGKLKISMQGCKQRDEYILRICKQQNIPLAISMGGGYSEDIRIIVEAHCNTFRLAQDLYF